MPRPPLHGEPSRGGDCRSGTKGRVYIVMKVRAFIITGSGTALIVPEPMPGCVVLNGEAKEIRAMADHQRIFDLKKDSALGLDKEAAEENLKTNKYFISHIPPDGKRRLSQHGKLK